MVKNSVSLKYIHLAFKFVEAELNYRETEKGEHYR